ncbi:MAG: type II secretion system F family protein, partial [Rhizobiaceae bacterium]
MDKAFEQFLDPITILSILVAVAVFATLFTLLPAFGGNPVKQRMKSVALERDALRAQQRARLAAESD